MQIRVDGRRVFIGVLALLILFCWITLSLWSISPYAPYLSHDLLEGLPGTFTQDYFLLLLIFVIAWTLMTIAMMLPTSLPLLVMFQRLTQSRPDRTKLVVLLIVGYLSVWILFGAVAHLGDMLIHDVVRRVAWLDANIWVISVAIFALAGLYQFSPLKYKCLDKCRSPMSFIVAHWQGRHEQKQSFLLGVHHGLFCLGCCWSLMLLMFAVSAGNVAWMLLLGTVMAVEKNVPWGRQLSAPFGIVLLGSSVLLAIVGMGLL
jgi:predicted metal-binding membrane protein